MRSGSVPVQEPLECSHCPRVQVSRAIAASADPDLNCADGPRADDTDRPHAKPALEGLDSPRIEVPGLGGADPVLKCTDRSRAHPSVDREPRVKGDGNARPRARHVQCASTPVGSGQSSTLAASGPGDGPLHHEDAPGDRDLESPAGSVGAQRVAGTAEQLPGRGGELQPAVVAVVGVDGPVTTALTGGDGVPDGAHRLCGGAQTDAGDECGRTGNGKSGDAVT